MIHRPASSTDPATPASHDAVTNAWLRAPSRYAGPGFVFSIWDPFCGIDLDDSLDAEGNVKLWYEELWSGSAIPTWRFPPRIAIPGVASDMAMIGAVNLLHLSEMPPLFSETEGPPRDCG